MLVKNLWEARFRHPAGVEHRGPRALKIVEGGPVEVRLLVQDDHRLHDFYCDRVRPEAVYTLEVLDGIQPAGTTGSLLRKDFVRIEPFEKYAQTRVKTTHYYLLATIITAQEGPCGNSQVVYGLANADYRRILIFAALAAHRPCALRA